MAHHQNIKHGRRRHPRTSYSAPSKSGFIRIQIET
jgi:hypothetical protein